MGRCGLNLMALGRIDLGHFRDIRNLTFCGQQILHPNLQKKISPDRFFLYCPTHRDLQSETLPLIQFGKNATPLFTKSILQQKENFSNKQRKNLR